MALVSDYEMSTMVISMLCIVSVPGRVCEERCDVMNKMSPLGASKQSDSNQRKEKR